MVATSNIATDPPSAAAGALAGFKTGVWNVVSLAVALGIWQVAALSVGSPFFPAPLRIAEAFVQLATRGDTFGHSLWTHSWASIQRVLVGSGSPSSSASHSDC